MALRKWGYMCTIVATLFVIIGYSTPYWLVSDLNIPKIRYYTLGLWNICLNNFRDPLYLYDMVFNGCRYIPIEDLWFIRDQILEPATFGTMAVIIFGARGDGRDWMPDPDHNYLSWSFALAVIGVYFLWVGSLLFFIEGRRGASKMANQASYPPATGQFIFGCVLSFISALFILISFASPYWLESFAETFQPFVRMGLWEFCFDNFRYPKYQFDRKFDGCNYVFSEEFLVIREWLQPGWLMFVEAMMCLALFFALLCLCVLAVILMRYFLFVEWLFLGIGFILQLLIVVPTFLAITVFGARCQDRNWFLNPLYNHPSWAYALAVIAFFLSGLAAFVLFRETMASLNRKRRSNHLVSETTPYRY
uniref:Uncharacterized protein n=1 Tax=Strigamia maritima TaxID=126957 RepID=T1JEE8_STRMM